MHSTHLNVSLLSLFYHNRNIIMKLQIASDLHLDMIKYSNKEELYSRLIEPSAQYLALVGDIAEEHTEIFYDFLTWTSKRFIKVFLVLGNHEYYNCDNYDKVNERINEFCKDTNIEFLDNKHIEIIENDITYHILGSTLWSFIPINKYTECMFGMNDYKLIRPHMAPKHTNNMHNKAALWLMKETQNINKDKNTNKIIVLTHHAPLYKNVANPIFETEDNTLRNAFCTDMSFIFNLPDICIDVWVYGHTHWITDFRYGMHDSRIVANCYGYGYPENIKYNKAKVIEV